MRTLLRPQLASLDLFASALLAVLGVAPQIGCSSEVIQPDGDGGGGSGEGNNNNNGGATTDGGSSGDGGANTSSAGGASPEGSCKNPTPLLVNGMETGFDVCEGGQLIRRKAIECPTNYPDNNPCCGGCPEGQICSDSGEVACSCVAACTNDAQCGAGELCLCGDPAGICIPAGCQSGDDCGSQQECTSWDPTQGCLYLEFECTTHEDTCGGNNDCPPEASFCNVQPDGHRECGSGGCAIGRPFLVHDVARTALVGRRTDWCADDVSPSLARLDAASRNALAEAWELTARMEHASIAAFARFSLQLMGLGAPAELLERANRAMADETKHARLAFALTSAYRGQKVGPGPLAIDGALETGSDLESVIRLVVREGCVGETVAAVEAGEAETQAKDPVIGRILGVIASDESEHAELAWRTVQWALAIFGDDVRPVVRSELARLERELSQPEPPAIGLEDEALLRLGVVTAPLRAHLRRATLQRAVVPCLRALSADQSAARAA